MSITQPHMIRLATKDDVPDILGMINELADYEQALSSVKATEESLIKTLSLAPEHASGYAKTFILTAQPENRIAAMALFFPNYSTWRAAPGIYLEDLYVRPEFRRRGYATLLLKELANEVLRMEGGRLEWSCLRWNESALGFYEGLGAVQMGEWVGLRVDGGALRALAEREVEGK